MRWSAGLLIIFIGAWFGNSHALLYFFPYTTVPEYYRFIAARNVAYEMMFLVLIGAIYLETKGILKSMSCFIMILVAASVIDKAVFHITWYIWSDIGLVGLALIVSAFVYGRNK